MADHSVRILTSSVFRKQIVAVTGVVLVLFIIGHLAGNLLILLGPEAFNRYAETLQSLGELLWAERAVMFTLAVLHVTFTVLLTMENLQARGQRYAVSANHGGTNFVRKTMIYSGALIFFFLFLHISDYTLADKTGPASIIAGLNNGESLGLYGLVWRSFLFQEHWWRPLVYIAAVVCVGAHLTHGIQSMFQTLGVNHERYTPIIRKVSVALGVIVGAGFSAIPIIVNLVGVPKF